MNSPHSITILGTVGVPANYGGFETLAENLVRHHHANLLPDALTIYCSSKTYPEKKPTYLSAKLKYVPLNANGAQSIPYDIWSLFSAVWNRADVILLLGVSGAIALPLIRFISSTRIVTNIDGIEWRREKWQGFSKAFLRFSERMAVRFSHEIISDNGAIAEYVKQAYGVDSHVIAYGGDHAINVSTVSDNEVNMPPEYAFSVCRIEPENNVHVIVEAFAALRTSHLIIVGNWDNSEYGRNIKQTFNVCPNITLLDPIYDLSRLHTLRKDAHIYIHGHSAGGTNPSLVEAMHFGRPVLAYDCDFNRSTTENQALFFANKAELMSLVSITDTKILNGTGMMMKEISQRRYTWAIVAQQYFELIDSASKK